MKIEEVGRMIYTLRTRAHISQQKLCHGICSVSTLSRLELGERRPDIFTFNSLLQRLGKSADYINVVLTLEEFRYIQKRWEAENAILIGNFSEAEKSLSLLEKELKGKEQPLQHQDIYRLYALLHTYRENNYAEALKYAERALLETIPEFNEVKAFPQYLSSSLCLSQMELRLLLLYSFIKEQLGEKETELLENVIGYIHFNITDKKAQNKELAPALHLQAYKYKKESLWKKCYQCCEEIIEAEVKNGGLLVLFQALEMEMQCLENGIAEENGSLRQKQYSHLKDVLEEYGKDILERKVFSYFLERTSQEKNLVDEVIQSARFRSGYSQEEISEGICAPVSFSRFEAGKSNPTIKNFYAIMEKTGTGIGYYNTELIVEQFETLEKIDKLKQRIILKHFDEADKLLRELEQEIDGSIVKNQQQIGLYHAVFDYRLGRITIEEALDRVEKLLELTVKITGNDFPALFQPTFIEISLLNQIAVYHRNMENHEWAVKILWFLYHCFQKGKLEAPQRSQRYFMVVGNLASYLEEQGELEKALQLVDESLKIGIKQNAGVRIGGSLIAKAYIQEKIGIDNFLINYEHGYYLCGLFGDFSNQNIVKERVFENWQIIYTS